MKLQAPKRILTEDFEEDDRSMAGKLGSIQNTYNEEVYLLSSGNITIGDNINQELKTLKVTVNSSGVPITKIAFQNRLKGKVQGMNVIRTFGKNSVLSAPFIEFAEVSQVINLTKIIGLVADVEYQLVIHIIGN